MYDEMRRKKRNGQFGHSRGGGNFVQHLTEQLLHMIDSSQTLKSYIWWSDFSAFEVALPPRLLALKAERLVCDGTFDSEFTPLNDFRWSLIMLLNVLT